MPLETSADVSTALNSAVETLKSFPAQHERLDQTECLLIEIARDGGMTWETLAAALGRGSGQAMQQRYKRIGGLRSWPTRRPGDVPGGPNLALEKMIGSSVEEKPGIAITALAQQLSDLTCGQWTADDIHRYTRSIGFTVDDEQRCWPKVE